MKRLLQFLILIVFLNTILDSVYARDKTNDDLLRKSELFESSNFKPDSSSYPMPFDELNNPENQAAVSTGYYFVDSDDYYAYISDYWKPQKTVVDTTEEPGTWFRIIPGPGIKPKSFWENNPNGLHFFRNPAIPADGDFFNAPTDSTDDAIAGPMPIGFDFYFNGLKFDSFYVSTNGIIALTNSRYYYDDEGNRAIPPGSNNCYNPMSMDWFFAGRERQGDGLNDPVEDNFGYFYAVCGGNPADTTAGIRARGGHLNQEQFIEYKTALIAPFFGDLQLSQYNRYLKQAEDWGKVYIKRSKDKDRLIIYYVNVIPVRELNTPYGKYEGKLNLRPGDFNYVSASAQITLDKKDSTITIVYEKFDGFASISGQAVPANMVFRYNTTIGVHGFARYTNFGHPEGEKTPWAGEYEQYTTYSDRSEEPTDVWLHNYLAIKFRQGKNVLRAVDISYRVRKKDTNANLDFSEEVPSGKVNNYELLAGDERLGALQPVGIFQNLSNEIQGKNGVNFQPQQLKFKARCRMIHEASFRIIYNRVLMIDSTCLAKENCTADPNVRVKYVSVSKNDGDYVANELPFPGAAQLNGIPPYGFVQVYFPPFEPNEYVNNHIGRIKVSLIADATDPESDETYGDLWPFDDTLNVRLHVIKRLEKFVDDFNSYHIFGRVPFPNTLRWVNINADIASGVDVSHYPLPPRGGFNPTNNEDFQFDEPDLTYIYYESPVVRMDRITFGGTEPATSPGGDELRSFPIDLRGRSGAVLSLSVQRTAKRDDWPRGWSDGTLIGPEPRTVVNADPFHVFSANGRAASAEPDELVVEFAKPSEDGINGITNIPEENWRYHPRRGGAAPVTDMPALSIFGAGGYMVGWLETDRDSALSRPHKPDLNGLRPDIFDDGIDFEFKKYFIPIPDTFINAPNEGAKNFRFRIKVLATNDKKCLACIPDDNDEFFIDNVFIDFSAECVDIELSAVKIEWPYTIVPAEQATAVPVKVVLTNNSSGAAKEIIIKVDVYLRGREKEGDELFTKTIVVPVLNGRQSVEIPAAKWNAGKTGPGEYKIVASIVSEPGNSNCDIFEDNNTNYTYVRLNFGDVIAYDPTRSPWNNVGDDDFTGFWGKGLGFPAYNYGGRGNIKGPTELYDELKYGAGGFTVDDSGLVALKFILNKHDTLFGYQVLFGLRGLTGTYDFHLSLYSDKNFMIPDTIIPGSFVYKFSSWDDIEHTSKYSEYVNHLLPEPIILEAGVYWMVIGTELTGLEVGGSKSNMGMRVTNVTIPQPVDVGGEIGKTGVHLLLNKKFRRYDNLGNRINVNFFAFKNGDDTNSKWIPFMPTYGNPGYAHLDHFGTSPVDKYTLTLSRGTWIPMIRPYFGSGHIVSVPLDEVYFDGLGHSKNIELFWDVPAGLNPGGFHVQKRIFGEQDWSEIAYIDADTKPENSNRYKFIDDRVRPATKYQYRLRIIDRDGAFAGEKFTKIVTLMLNILPELSIERNTPNPARTYTNITYYLPQAGNVKLDILDLFGNKIKTLANGNESAGRKSVLWHLEDDLNRPVPSGTYIIRLSAGNEMRTMKMTVVR